MLLLGVGANVARVDVVAALRLSPETGPATHERQVSDLAIKLQVLLRLKHTEELSTKGERQLAQVTALVVAEGF